MTHELPLSLELEGVHDSGGQIQVVRDYGLRVDGYALYLRYQTEQGYALAEWLCDHPQREWLYGIGNLLATSYHLPLHDLTPQGLAQAPH